VALAREVGMAHGVAVDRRIVERRQIERRQHIVCDHAAVGGAERHALDIGDRRDPLADHALGLLDRQERPGEGEAVVGELRHQVCSISPGTEVSGAACRIKISVTPSMSSSATTGTLTCGSGTSEATAITAGSFGAISGMPTAARCTSSLGCGARLYSPAMTRATGAGFFRRAPRGGAPGGA